MTFLSGNTLGARLWTDGKQVAPMLPQPPAVVQCAGCETAYWLEDAEELEAADTAVPEVAEPTARQYYEAIAGGLASSPERERLLRILAMWRENDPSREVTTGDTRQLSPAAVENLTSLAGLLADSAEADSQLMMAEMLRELGRFDEAKVVLASITDGEYSWVVDTLQALCDERDSAVREMTRSG